jgi:short-subunit dehydrogenase
MQRTHLSLGLTSLGVGLLLARQAWRRSHRYSFRDRTVIITGGSRGLGLALAREFASEGARLWLVARSPQALHEAAAELRSIGAHFVETIAADLRHENEIDRVVERVLRGGDVIDVLVNNAGVIEVSPFEHAQVVDFEDSLATHFWAPFHLVRKFLPHMRREGEGRIVNISSVGGRVAVPHLAAYAAGKFALTGFSEALRAELVKEGVYVTTVTPFLMRTGSYVNVRVRGQHEREFRWFTAMSATPLTSMLARRAAAQIVTAVREGRASVAPGWQSRLAQTAAAATPNVVAGLSALVDRAVLPQPTKHAAQDDARIGAEIDPGPIKHVLPERTRRRFHQPGAAWDSAPA